jgi:hypothetical protein
MDANSTIWTPTAQLWTPTRQYGRQQHNMDASSTKWTPTTREFLQKFAKKSSEGRKICEERRKKE